MTDKGITVGVAYNEYVPIAERHHERIADESVAIAAADVHEAVTNLGYAAHTVNLGGNIADFLKQIAALNPDVLVNLCESFNGRPVMESNIAALFELHNIPFTGNSAKTLALCLDKFNTKAILSAHGLPTPRCQRVSSSTQNIKIALPAIVKPNNEDASLGIYVDSVVDTRGSLFTQIEKVATVYKQAVLVEEFIEGREFNVAVWKHHTVEALPPSEIDFSDMPEDAPHICSYEAKWHEDHSYFQGTRPVCPAEVPRSVDDRLRQLAIRAFNAIGCRDYARVDFRMNDRGRLYILEVNPNPDISVNAGYARALKAAGISYQDFWRKTLQIAMQRKENA